MQGLINSEKNQCSVERLGCDLLLFNGFAMYIPAYMHRLFGVVVKFLLQFCNSSICCIIVFVVRGALLLSIYADCRVVENIYEICRYKIMINASHNMLNGNAMRQK